MHIAFVSTQFMSASLVGGLGNYLLRAGLALREMAHHPTIFMIADDDNEEDFRGIRLISVAGKRHSPAARLLHGDLHANEYHSRLLNRAVRRVHQETPIDIVQFTNYRATALHRAEEIPSVIRVSSYRPFWDRFHPTAGQSRSRRRAARLEKAAFYKADAVYSPSQVLADAISKDLQIDVAVIEPPFIMDAEELDPSPMKEATHGEPFFLYAGHLTQRKGALVLRDALNRILSEYPTHRFVFVGRTDIKGERISPDILLAAAGEHSDRVTFLGTLKHEALYPFYRDADAVILPSIIDNIANTGLEAMAMGAIVVGTDGGSFEQLIEEGCSGFLCAPEDPDSLLDAVRRAMRIDTDEAARLRSAAQKRIKELRPERTIAQLVDFYKKVIAKEGR